MSRTFFIVPALFFILLSLALLTDTGGATGMVPAVLPGGFNSIVGASLLLSMLCAMVALQGEKDIGIEDFPSQKASVQVDTFDVEPQFAVPHEIPKEGEYIDPAIIAASMNRVEPSVDLSDYKVLHEVREKKPLPTVRYVQASSRAHLSKVQDLLRSQEYAILVNVSAFEHKDSAARALATTAKQYHGACALMGNYILVTSGMKIEK